VKRKASLLIPSLLSGIAIAQSAGTFTATGNMTTARWGSTATLLLTGKVLIAGGQSKPNGPVSGSASAELYDPSTGTFTATGDMITARVLHTATLLPDGKVLIVGGLRTSSAEVYDPTTGTFTATGAMVVIDNNAPSAVLLADGRVLIVHTTAAELYDPVSCTFSATADPLSANNNVAIPLDDGRVLVATSADAETYDPASGTFRVTGAPNPALIFADWFAAAPLTNGKVLLAGGYCEECNSYSAAAELYDPLMGTCDPTGDMTTGRAFHTATPLGDGTVLIAGNGIASGSAEVYDPVSGTFSRTGSMTTIRASGHTATLLLDGTVLIAGGTSNIDGTPQMTSAEVYMPSKPVPAPMLLSISGDGKGQGAIQHGDTYELVSANDPAVAGEIVVIYCTGLSDGGAIPPKIAIGGRMTEVLYFGNVTGYSGLNQINVRVPNAIAPGSTVGVRLQYMSRPSNEVTIAVRP
jgi:uncharacterized protein (TIGR03437 family)